PAGGPADGGGVLDQPVGDADRGQARHRRALDRVDIEGRAAGAADAVVVRGGGGGEARADGGPQELAGADELAPRGLEEAGGRGGEVRAAALAQRVQRARAGPAGRDACRRRGRAARSDDRARRIGRRRGGDRHAGRDGGGDPAAAGRHGRLRRRARLRARLGKPRGDIPLVGALRAVRDPGDQWLQPRADRVGRIPRGEQEGTDGGRLRRGDGEDPGRPARRGGDGGDDQAGAGAGAGRRLAPGRRAGAQLRRGLTGALHDVRTASATLYPSAAGIHTRTRVNERDD